MAVPEYCAYYDKNSLKIIDYLPQSIPQELRSKIENNWADSIKRGILILLSEEGEFTAPRIQEKIGHSMSTIHQDIQSLENEGLIETEMIYKQNKQKMLRSRVLFVTKNPKSISTLKEFLNKGIWVDKKKNEKILSFLNRHPTKYFTAEEISAKTQIPIDEVNVLLENWNSQVTRAFSDLFKDTPFEKKTLYRAKK